MRENAAMKARIAKLEQQIKTDNESFENRLFETFGKFLSRGQIRLLLNPALSRIKWSPEDIASAVSFRCASPKGYRYMKDVLKMPLPGLSTLRRWANRIRVEPGILSVVLDVMKMKENCTPDIEKLVVLTFDEMYLNNKISIDRETECVIGPHRTCQCVMVRTLFSGWKQPIYFDYDKSMNASTLFGIITTLHDCGYTVVAVTSDMGPGNMKLWAELGIGMHPKHCYFQNPACNELRIFVFADMPHLIKLIRNHFLDGGFNWKEQKIEISVVQKLIAINCKDLKIAYKITDNHLTVQGTDRQKVRPAVQLLSSTTAQAIRWCSERGFFGNIDVEHTAMFIQLCNDWFDTFNAKCKFHKTETKCAYGIHLAKQNEVLNRMTEFISECRFGNHKSMLNFQKGICISNASLQQLLPYLQEKYNTCNISYILTYRLNQDLLEHFFSFVRSLGATYDHPNALDFRFRLKRYILGKHSNDLLSSKSNVGNDIELDKSSIDFNESLLSNLEKLDCKKRDIEEVAFFDESHDCNNNCISLESESYTLTCEEEQLLSSLEELEISDVLEEEALKYVAGYVAFCFKNKYNALGNETKNMEVSEKMDWLPFVSRGKCIYPAEKWLKTAKIIDAEFQKFHGTTLRRDKWIFKLLYGLISSKLSTDIPKEVIMCFIRTRTYIRVNNINNALTAAKFRKRKKKIVKFTNKKIKL